jgi:integrase
VPNARWWQQSRVALQPFVDWLTSRPGRSGPLSDRSVANALTPLRAALDAAVAEDLLEQNAGAPSSSSSGRFTREKLARLLNEIPPKWRPLFDLLAETGLRISEALGLLERPRAPLGRAAAASQPRRSSRGRRSPEVPSRGANRAAAV